MAPAQCRWTPSADGLEWTLYGDTYGNHEALETKDYDKTGVIACVHSYLGEDFRPCGPIIGVIRALPPLPIGSLVGSGSAAGG